MTNIIGTFSFPLEKKAMMDEFKKIANREGINQSRLLITLVEDYVKNHSEGNPNFTIEQFQDPDFVAMPATMSPLDKWDKFIKQNMTIEERRELDKRFIDLRKTINAANYKDTGVSERL